jgi:hypothetical protein
MAKRRTKPQHNAHVWAWAQYRVACVCARATVAALKEYL